MLKILCVSALWYVDTIVTLLFSLRFSTVTGREYLFMIFPFFSLLSFTYLGTFFPFSFSVSTQSVECSIFSFLANSALLKKFSIHSVCPRPNKGSKSSNTTAAILRLLQLCRQFNITTANTVIANITETFVRIVHNYQHFTVCQNFSVIPVPQVSLLSQQLNEVHD